MAARAHGAMRALFACALLACSAEEPRPHEAPREALLTLAIDTTLAAGTEEYVCRYFVIPPAGFAVAGIEQRLDPRSHHLLLFSTTLTPADVEGELDSLIHDCATDVKSHSALDGLLYGAQPGEASLRYPAGSALELAGDQVVFVEHHVVNDSSAEISAHAELELVAARTPVARQAGLFHFYDWAIDVPPLSSASSRMRCAISEALELVFLHGHMHERGREFRAWVDRRGELLPLYAASEWNSPTEQLLPPFALEAGDAIEFECDYENAGTTAVRQGFSAKADEMCSLTAAYVAADGERLDVLSEACGGSHSGVVGAGTLDCGGIEACIAAAVASSSGVVEAARAAQPCWLEGCPTKSIAFRDLALCRFTSCAEACGLRADSGGFVAAPSDQAGCDACIEATCAEPAARCASADCSR